MRMNDTIAANSTAPGEAGISIVRISGSRALEIGDHVFFPARKGDSLSGSVSHTVHYGTVRDQKGIIDEVLVSVFRAPRSYTTEDTVEINCHGGMYAVRRILECVCNAGARPANPGEFTQRAFLNGRIDLTQAEAVMDIIHAGNEQALRNSLRQLKGILGKSIDRMRKEILHEIAFIEAALDDPEHYSLDSYPPVLVEKTDKWIEELTSLLSTADYGKQIREGIHTAIAGKPNAGKSTLLNLLLQEERAIVTDIAGTTRDVVTENCRIGDLSLVLYDTAGIRKTSDKVEKIGVEKSRRTINEVDLVLFMVDSSCGLDENDLELIRELVDKKVIIIWNKTDLDPVLSEEELLSVWEKTARECHLTGQVPEVVKIAAGCGEGLDIIEKAILKMFGPGFSSSLEETCITNSRHKSCMQRALEELQKTKEGLDLMLPEDFLTITMTGACDALGEITGETIRDDLADEIFSHFCMGK